MQPGGIGWTVASTRLRGEYVSHSAAGGQQALLPRPVDLAAQVGDVDLEHVRIWTDFVVPESGLQPVARLNATDMSDQVLEDTVLHLREHQRPTRPGRLPPDQV